MSTGVLLWLRAETSVHVGAGETASLIDLPIMREAATSYPYIPGSALKGAMKDAWRGKPGAMTGAAWKAQVDRIFGKEESAGEALVSDARLAFLPLRSLDHAFVLTTCPYLLRRLKRDYEFAGLQLQAFQSLAELDGKAENIALLTAGSGELGVEDQWLQGTGPATSDKANEIYALVEAATQEPAPVVVVSNALFGYFARRRIPVRMRNRLEPETKTVVSGALWSEEALPPETLLYTILTPRLAGATSPDELASGLVEPRPYLQVGGNETVGEGWLRVFRAGSKAGGAI